MCRKRAGEADQPAGEVRIPAGSVTLQGSLDIPPGAGGLVLFAHGSGSSRFSPRNRYVADVLREKGLATLLFDLLTAEEEVVDSVTREHRFNIPLLAGRVVEATRWARGRPETAAMRVGYFGASTGAAAALIAAAELPDQVGAVVSRGGRPDLAGEALRSVRAPTLLVVGGYDTAVIELNRAALAHLSGEKELVIVPGASHLFEEPGKLEEVARLAADWFDRHLAEGAD